MSTNQDIDVFVDTTIETILQLPAIRRGEVLAKIKEKVVLQTKHAFDQAQRQADDLKQALENLDINLDDNIPTRRL